MISNFSLALPVVYLPMLWCQLDKFCRQAVQQFSLLIVFQIQIILDCQFKMNWIAIISMIAWTSVVECGNIDFETCPEHGPATIEVVHDSYIKLSGNLECSFVIKPKSTLFVKVEIEDVNATNPHHISFFNGDTSKLCEYNEKEMFKYIIISTNLEVRKADIQAKLKITPLPSTKINGNQTQSSEIVFIPYQIGKSTLDLEYFLLDFVLPNRKTATTTMLPTTKMTTPITTTTTTTSTTTPTPTTTTITTTTTTTSTNCIRRSIYQLISSTRLGTIQKPNDSWCTSCHILPYIVENEITIKLSGKLKCSLFIQPMHADEIKVEVMATGTVDFSTSRISFWTCNTKDEEFRLRGTQKLLMLTKAVTIVAAQVIIEDIHLDAELKITPISNPKLKKVSFVKLKIPPTIQPKKEKPTQKDASPSNAIIAQVLSLILLGVLVIFLSVALVVHVALKSQNQVVPVVSFSNNVIHIQATTNSEIAAEGSSSNHQEIRNVPNVRSFPNVLSVPNIPSVPNAPRSLPSYSECEFDQHNLSSNNQEPPSYNDALKVELNLIMQPYVGTRL